MLERPLRGEPLSLDLVNTEWWDGEQPVDLLAEPASAAAWLAANGYPDGALPALRTARGALRVLLERGEPDALNEVLARGRRTPVIGPDGPGEIVDVEPGWRAAWEVAVAHLELLADRGDRIRRCAHATCVLYFHDTSRAGTRRWCSMETCGNRAKAGRHYARTRGRG